MNYSYNSNPKPWAPKPEKVVKTSKGKSNFVKSMESKRESLYGVTPNQYNRMRSEFSVTENGAIGYKSTGKAVLDLNYQISSLRNKDENYIRGMFRKAWDENPVVALRWLFYAGDVREGNGERRLFRICLEDMMNHGGKEIICNLIPLIPEYNRWDMLYAFVKNPVTKEAVKKVIRKQWNDDLYNMRKGKNISLMAKWLKSSNSHNPETRKYGLMTADMLGMNERQYRKMVSAFRKHLDVVERKMSSQNWQAIDYETVPSKANLNYNNAFLKHDEDRRRCYLNALTKGEAKINSSVVYPHEIVHKMNLTNSKTQRNALEGMWKSLPNLVKDDSTTLVVADGSGSMCTRVDTHGGTTALEVANALAIYFAERAKGPYHGKYITFSCTPKFVNVNHNTLYSNLQEAYRHSEVANTNIERVFDLILKTAIENNSPQSDLPDNILIVSDMELDDCATCGEGNYWRGNPVTKTLFDTIASKYAEYGYKLPKLVFWNVNSRTGTVPVRENALGVILVSGFSVNTLKMVMQNETDPYKALLNVVLSKRYDAVENAAFKA